MPNPTVHPSVSFDPEQDAKALHKAMKGFGTNEATIIAILCHRSCQQRLEIANTFKAAFGKELRSELKSELSGDFERLIIALITPWADYMASEVHHAIQGAGTNEKRLIEILCSCNNEEIRNISVAYEHLYRNSLESTVKSDLSGVFKHLMVAIMQGARDENEFHVNEDLAVEDAKKLYEAGEAKRGTDESEFNLILSSRSFLHLCRVMDEYERLRGHSLEKAIKAEFSGIAVVAMNAILSCAKNRPAYFAECLYDKMVGLGTRDRDLIRIIVSRSEIDLADIRNEFESKYKKTLSSEVKKETSGDYRKTLITLIE